MTTYACGAYCAEWACPAVAPAGRPTCSRSSASLAAKSIQSFPYTPGQVHSKSFVFGARSYRFGSDSASSSSREPTGPWSRCSRVAGSSRQNLILSVSLCLVFCDVSSHFVMFVLLLALESLVPVAKKLNPFEFFVSNVLWYQLRFRQVCFSLVYSLSLFSLFFLFFISLSLFALKRKDVASWRVGQSP